MGASGEQGRGNMAGSMSAGTHAFLTDRMRNDIIEGFKKCGISNLGFGWMFADDYHWRDGVEVGSRPGGDGRNGMGTVTWLCQLIGAEPYIMLI